MNPTTKLITLAALSSLLLAGCGKKEEPAAPSVTQEDVKAAQTTAEKNADSKLAAGLADAKKEAEKTIADAAAATEAKMKAELETKLAEQKKALTAQFAASNQALREQVEALTKKFETAKPQLPEPLVSSFQSKLPSLETSVSSLEKLVSTFSPSTLEQVETFKKRYENELGIAKKVADELTKLLANTKYGDMIPKF